MRKIIILSMLLFLSMASCKNNIQAQQPDNKKPMYGEVEKTEEYRKLDEEFIATTTALNNGSREKGSDSFNKKVWSYLYHDSLDMAIKRFNQAWLLNPENPEAYFGFGAILELRNNKSEADRMYQIGLSKDKDGSQTEKCYQKIADCKEHLQDIKGTIETYEKITVVNPKNSFAYQKLGLTKMEIGDNEGAKKDFEECVKLDSQSGELRRFLGIIKMILNDNNGACKDLNIAMNLGDSQSAELKNKVCK